MDLKCIISSITVAFNSILDLLLPPGLQVAQFELPPALLPICAIPSMRKYFCFDFHKSKHKSKRAHTFSQLIAIMLAEIEARANTFTNVCANIAAQTE